MTLQFYTKPDCELCDKAKIIFDRIQSKLSYISIEEIDITKNLGLFTKYKERIPVIELEHKMLGQHKIEERRLLWILRWNYLLKILNRS
ncbi:glutaredoxin family protein [Candidatus Poribacteria bacterium]|nr:glutaredoxin family protein [Candidatus Poribacteria bacterium]